MNSVVQEIRSGLARFAQNPSVLVATDFDGVLAPIVLDPAAAKPLPGTVATLRRIATLPGVHVAIASGRDLATLRKLTGLDGDDIVLIGSHGAETSKTLTAGATTASTMLGVNENQALSKATEALEHLVEDIPAARIEHKPAGVVLHTRGLPNTDADKATTRALDLPGRIPGLHAMRGKSVVELTVLDVSKGASLSALAQKVNASATAYFGDDVTDETAFAALPAAAGHFTVKVGEGETAAAYRLATCEEVPALLTELEAALQARTGS